jgi:REP element-mobilizing transposase RayT
MATDKPTRKTIRLQSYDYASNGAYFVTVCTHEKRNTLWNVGASFGRPQEILLSATGVIVKKEISGISGIYQNVVIDKYVVMPNHVHMIIALSNLDNGGRPEDAPTISRIVQRFKGAVSKKAGYPVWQKSFYDHIIRTEQEYAAVWQYIDTNPLKCQEDPYYISEP